MSNIAVRNLMSREQKNQPKVSIDPKPSYAGQMPKSTKRSVPLFDITYFYVYQLSLCGTYQSLNKSRLLKIWAAIRLPMPYPFVFQKPNSAINVIYRIKSV